MENNTAQDKPSFKRKDIQQEVTDTIIKQLEKGVVPWHQPWLSSLPKNAITNNAYRGINIVLLWGACLDKNYTTDEFATLLQWNQKKESVRKGEKGNLIVYYDTMEKEVDGEIKNIPFLKASHVFNRCQLASYVPDTAHPAKPVEPAVNLAVEFICNTDLVVEHSATQDACYIPLMDKIIIPYLERFEGSEQGTAPERYMATLFHEVIHATGHRSRLDRNISIKFGDKAYAAEELTAELGASFLCAEFAIPTVMKGSHASYIGHWLNVLKENKQYIFTAAKEASKAVSYLHNRQPTG